MKKFLRSSVIFPSYFAITNVLSARCIVSGDIFSNWTETFQIIWNVFLGSWIRQELCWFPIATATEFTDFSIMVVPSVSFRATSCKVKFTATEIVGFRLILVCFTCYCSSSDGVTGWICNFPLILCWEGFSSNNQEQIFSQVGLPSAKVHKAGIVPFIVFQLMKDI